MALVLKDRVLETCTSPGTGTVTLLGAVTGYQSFSTVGNGNTCYYAIADQSGANWEVGIGTYSSSGTLARTTVLSSSNSSSLVNFSTGSQNVFLTYPSSRSVNLSSAALTSGRVAYATTDGLLTDSANLTFDGTNLSTTGSVGIGDFAASSAVGANVRFIGNLTSTDITGVSVSISAPTTASTSTIGVYSSLRTTATSGSRGVLSSFYAEAPSIGATSTATTIRGLYVNNQGNASITNAYGIYIEPQSGSPSVNFGLYNGGTSRLEGNVGIGVTPSAWGGSGQVALQIGTGTSGTANFAGGGTKTLISSNQYYNGSVNKYINNGYAQAMVLDTDSSFSWIQAASGTAGNTASFFTKMTLDANGNLLVGTTTANNNNSSSFAFNVENGNQYNNHISGTGSGTGYIQFALAGTVIGSITQSGTTAVLYNVTSDQRLKTNIVDAPSGNIDDIKIRSFDWVTDGTHQEYGMVAQELLEVAPYAVYQPQNSDEMMAVDYSKLVPMMIKEIQDLKQRILTLENK